MSRNHFSAERLAMCPAELLPEVAVRFDEPSLAVSDMDARQYLRERLPAAEIHAEFLALSELGERRMAYGDRSLLMLGGARTYQDVGTPIGAADWLHEHELHRLNQLGLAMPSPGEEREAARQRIAGRIAARKARRASRVPDSINGMPLA